VGLDDFNANAASAVAVYQDGVYMQSPAGQLFQFYDVENVEVLRGPQGSLYRNASAGAILLQSKRPSDEFNTYLTATYGNYDNWEMEAAVGGPIVPDFLSGRLSGTWGDRDGVTQNRCAYRAGESDGAAAGYPCEKSFPDGTRVVDPDLSDKTNDIDYFAARGQLLLTLPIGQTETQWLLNVHGGQNRSRAYQYQHRGVQIVTPRELVRLYSKKFGTPVVDASQYRDLDGDFFAGDYNIDGPENIDLWGINLEATWLFGDDEFELRSLTAYEWNELYRVENSDGGPRFLLEWEAETSAWQFSEQLELRGPIHASKYGDGDWTLGVYYLQETLDVFNFFDQSGATDLNQEYTQDMWNFAGYGQGEYRLQPGCAPISCDFTLTAGLRYNWEHKSFDTFVQETPLPGIQLDSLEGEDATVWAGASGELSLAWNYAEDSNIYIKYARGWKGGHFNGGATSIRDIITDVEPEIVDSYEAGLRSSWFDHRLNLNLTGFYYDYLDLQVFIIEQTDLGYPISKLANASDAVVYGLELDVRTEPMDGLRLSLNAAWVESEYKDFAVKFNEIIRFPKPCRTCPLPDPLFVVVPRKFDYSGNTLIASPNFSATGSIEYDIPLPGQIAGRGLGILTPRFSFTWKDDMVYDACGGRGNRCNFTAAKAENDKTAAVLGNGGFFGQDAFWTFNAALTWSSENEMFSVTGFVHNFMDKHYKTQSFDLSRGLGVILDAYADPRTYGVTVNLAY
jgi:iron complex outermembrane receptor protein